jgi:hypothetical protein
MPLLSSSHRSRMHAELFRFSRDLKAGHVASLHCSLLPLLVLVTSLRHAANCPRAKPCRRVRKMSRALCV